MFFDGKLPNIFLLRVCNMLMCAVLVGPYPHATVVLVLMEAQ